jgi:hypothetical protein
MLARAAAVRRSAAESPGTFGRVVIAVLAILFLREAMEWAVDIDLLGLAAAFAIVIAARTSFLTMKG